jgi:hypothetical protein
MKIFCCKFSEMRNCIKDKIPAKITPITTKTTNTIHDTLILPAWIKLIIAWIPKGNDKLIKPEKMA